MTSHFSNEKFNQLNLKLSENLFQAKYQVRAYQNSSFAVYDLAMGLQQYLSHKNHLGIVKNGSSLIEGLTPHWLRQGVPLQLKGEAQTWAEYIENLNSETNFVLWSSENEITGEVIVSEKEALEIHERLSKKRVFSIQITQQLAPDIALPNYSVIILRNSVFNDSSCLAVMTDKMKALSLIGPYQNISPSPAHKQRHVTDFNTLEVIEKKLESNLYFQSYAITPPRLTDRVVLYIKDISGQALKEDLRCIDELCIAPSHYPFWILQSWKNWWKEAESEALLRGLCIVSMEAFEKDPDLPQKIQESIDKIRRLSQWNVLR